MTIARRELVDPTMTRWYHCMSRCVRRAFLLGEGDDNRRLWLERGKELAEVFAVAVGGFSVWKIICICCCGSTPRSRRPGRTKRSSGGGESSFRPAINRGGAMPVSEHWVQWQMSDIQWVATAPRDFKV